jgi:hypothetical protein
MPSRAELRRERNNWTRIAGDERNWQPPAMASAFGRFPLAISEGFACLHFTQPAAPVQAAFQ